MTAFSVIALLATQASGAAGGTAPSAHSRAQGLQARVLAPDNTLGANRSARPQACPSARQAVRFYGVRVDHWRALMGAGPKELGHAQTGRACPSYLAHVLQRKASQLRLRWRHEYAWWEWMSAKFQRIGACETGYGRRPGDFHWNSGTYQGFAGFYFGTWDAYKPRGAPSEAYLATPRDQYECALNVLAHHGYGAWGCGGA